MLGRPAAFAEAAGGAVAMAGKAAPGAAIATRMVRATERR